jgi:hypothetical protein
MSCMPKSGGCEWRRIKPFIQHLNRLEGTSYRLDVCLDRNSRNRPEPEVRCTQVSGGVGLVVERKCVVWPKDYSARHNLDHRIADDLFNNLNPLVGESPYAILLEHGFHGTISNASAFAAEIVSEVKRNLSELGDDKELCGDFDGHHWAFYRDPDFERRGDNRPGLVVRWDVPLNLEIYGSPPAGLLDEIQRLLNSAARKFRNYLNDRRILLIAPEGRVPCLVTWWSELFEDNLSGPAEISEIWLASEGVDESEESHWLYEKLWPLSIQSAGQAA